MSYLNNLNENPCLTKPIPNSEEIALIGDFSLGDAGWSLNRFGTAGVSSADDVPFGSAYIGINSYTESIELSFASDVVRVGAYVTGLLEENPPDPWGIITLSVYNESEVLLDSISVYSVPVSDWGSNFIGLENPGIRKISLSGPYMVLDGLTFEESSSPVPEPSTCLLFFFGMLGIVGVKKRFRLTCLCSS